MDLSKEPISTLVRKISVPTSIGFFFHTMFNVVDTYFAGYLSTDALAALSLSFPIFFTFLAFGIGLSQGLTALISNSYGEGDDEKSLIFFRQGLSLGLIVSVGLTALGIIFVPDLFRLLGASEEYLDKCMQYMTIIIWGSFLFSVQNVFNGALSAKGLPKPFRNFLIGGFVLNVLLDPLFMFGYGFFPAMGVSGLAASTILIQFFGAIYMGYESKRAGFWKGARLKDFIPNPECFKKVVSQSVPASLNLLTIAIGTFIITYYISKFGKLGVAAYGAAIRIEQIVLIPTIGLNSAVLTLVGHNKGAMQLERSREAWAIATKLGVAMMVGGGIFLFFGREILLSAFTQEKEVIEAGSKYLVYASTTLAAYVIIFTTNALLQGLKKPSYAVYIGVIRQFIGPLIFFPILSGIYGLEGIWIGIIVVTWMSAFATLYFGIREVRRQILAEKTA